MEKWARSLKRVGEHYRLECLMFVKIEDNNISSYHKESDINPSYLIYKAKIVCSRQLLEVGETRFWKTREKKSQG